ncbi:hypothetical protein GOV07_05990 [Candidatus Woesearchaeota archaeon]|nr:hypothetical protein [Candidatus Woesearchaeota archaeon]
MREIVTALGLVAVLAGCAPREAPISQATPTPIVSTTPAEPIVNPACPFNTLEELERFASDAIKAEIPASLQFYNERFGTNYSMDDMQIENGTFDGLHPDFHYDFDNHVLRLDLLPSEKALATAREVFKDIKGTPEKYQNMDTYLAQLKNRCDEEFSEWRSYKDVTVGFVPHEVAHWYHDEFMRREGITLPGPERDTPQWKGLCMVIEGTAVWMTTLIDPKESVVREYNDPVNAYAGQGPWHFVYPAGEMLVTPILNEDFLGGLHIMSASPPAISSAEDMTRYQQQVIAELRGQ